MNTDRLIGSITIVVASFIVAFIAFFMWQNERDSHNTVYVLFSEIGALQNEDEVTIRGYKIGHVASITMANDSIVMANDSIRMASDSTGRSKKRDAMALVKIDLYESFTFSKDTRFRNVSPSILGNRSIIIQLGKSGKRIPKDYIFFGEFEPGFAEVLALADIAKEQVANLMELVRLLQSGDSNNSSLQEKVEGVLKDCEDLVETLARAINAVDKQAFAALDKVGDYAKSASDASIEIGNSINSIRVQAQDGIKSLEKLVLDVQAAVEGLNKVLEEFESNPVAAALLDDRGIIDDIEKLGATLQAFLGSLDGRGLKIYDEKGKRQSMVKFKNIHIFGDNARDKAKKQKEEK